MPGKICLNMIVKNEEENILDCLKNVAHLVDAIAIVDTGSTDKTVKIINKFMEINKIPGEVIVRPWYGFNVSRTEALRYGEDVVYRILKYNMGPAGECTEKFKAPKKWKSSFETNMLSLEEFNAKYPKINNSKTRDNVKYDGSKFLEERISDLKLTDFGTDNWYLMFMDADNRLRVNHWTENCQDIYKIDKEKMDDEQYGVDMKQGPITYRYAWMVKVNPEKRWIWKKEIHEHVLSSDWENPKRGKMLGAYILSGRTGSRSKDPCKYLNDAVICERHMLEDPNDDHYFFYGAQSYRDSNKCEEALKLYLKRAEMKGWMEQVYISYLEAGKLQQRIDNTKPLKALEYFLKAFEITKNRLEAPFFIMEIYKSMKLFTVAWEFAKPLLSCEKPSDLLFVDQSIHDWLFYSVCADCAFYANDFKGVITVAEKALASGGVPSEHIPRLQNIILNAKQRLGPS